jgi:hypothetical protein
LYSEEIEMTPSFRDFLHRSHASLTVPIGFALGSGVAFIACLLIEENALGHFDSRLTLTALEVALWFGLAGGAIAFLAGAFVFPRQDRTDK